ncbi:MAG: hypothetical protein EOP82_24960 [Variovorax sp.]|nr:MAG: hypothetical protein EOP82_24960 [Variovorax sp.]
MECHYWSLGATFKVRVSRVRQRIVARDRPPCRSAAPGEQPEVSGVRCSKAGFGHGTWGRFRAADPATSSGAAPHQPLIWRRLIVCRDTNIAQLHHILQVAFGWEDLHLHRFEIRGREYDVFRDGGLHFSTDARPASIGDLHL